MIQTNDLINGLFECIGGFLLLLNVFKIIKDKKLTGVSWIPILFFTCWGAWNLYYYPSLNQTLSFIGGVLVFATNLTWIALVFYYKYKKQ